MPGKTLNWGLLSTADINEELIPVLKSSSRNKLTTIASRNVRSAEKYAREWGIPRAHGSYEALIQDPEVDVIYNPLPNHLHAKWTIEALRAGKHVLCEKPLGLTVEEVDTMEAASRESDRVLAEAFMYRHHSQTQRVMEIVGSGTLGTLQVIKGAFTFSLKDPQDIRMRTETGGGSVWDVGCYPVSYARMVAGADPLEVFGWQVSGAGGVDEIFTGQMRFPNEVLVQFESGFRSPERQYMEIVGSEGVLRVPRPFNMRSNERLVLVKGEEEEVIEIPGEELYKGEVEDMADAVLNGVAPRVSLADSRGNVAAIVALLESARAGQPVSV
jgi:xylose dehydrogenase (NAD/NADP)